MKFSPSIYLEYGADETTCDDQEFEICERGMAFNSRWQFEVGTEFRVAFSYSDSLGISRRIPAQGIVVGCDSVCAHCYRVSLLFLDVEDALRAAIADVSGELEASVGEQGTMARRIPSI